MDPKIYLARNERTNIKSKRNYRKTLRKYHINDNNYYQLKNPKHNLSEVINDGLGRGGDGAPVADPGLSAEAFADYFDRKVADIRSATDGAPPPVFRDSPTSDRLSTFIPVTTDVICTMVRVATDRYSM